MDHAWLPRSIDALGELRALDAGAAPLTPLAHWLTGDDARSRLLHGAVIGHRLHPPLTDAPLGLWSAAGVLDLVGGRAARPAARRLTGLGLLATAPTVAAGLADWHGTDRPERRMGVAHALANGAGVVCEWRSWRARRRGRHLRGALWSAAGLSALAVGGAIGGHLAFGRRIGVAEHVPVADDGAWHAAGPASAVADGRPVAATIGDAPVALVRNRGRICAMAARCNHAGGPLGEGSVTGDGLVCPWHGSRFSLADGSVERGPAVAAQPVYDVRDDAGTVELRFPRAGAATTAGSGATRNGARAARSSAS